MKKLLFFIAAAALLVSSCVKENFGAGKEVTVSLTARIPDDIATKAYSDGLSATKLVYAIYDSNSNTPLFSDDKLTFENYSVTIDDLVLITGKTYDLLFWAQSPSNTAYSVDLDNQTMTVDYAKMLANDERNDAFFAFEQLTVNGAINQTISLYRPFAQVNLGTNDLMKSQDESFRLERTSMTAKVANVLHFADGSVSGDAVFPFAANDVPNLMDDGTIDPDNKDGKFPVEGYDTYLAMNYLLVGKDQTVTNCEFKIYEHGRADDDETNTITVTNVPVKRNYRTNIYGSLLTDPASLKIKIEPGITTLKDVEIKEVQTIDNVKDAIAGGATNVTVAEALKADGSVLLPAVSSELAGKEVTITLPATEYDVTFSYETPTPEAGKDNIKNVSINAPGTNNLTINLPQSHVTLNGQNYGTVNASVSSTTLVVPEGVTVETLNMLVGNAEIYGTVGTVSLATNCVVTAYAVETAAELEKALAYRAQNIILENYDAFKAFADSSNKGTSFEKTTVTLATDIDLTNVAWIPIGTATAFKGVFDGGNHTVKNLTVAVTKTAFAGLFSNVIGTVKNVKLANVNISGNWNAAALVASIYGTVENCHVDGGTIISTPHETKGKYDDANNVGGLVGHLCEGTNYIKTSSVKNLKVTAYRDVAGLVGKVNNGSNVVANNTVENVVVTANQLVEYCEVKDANAGEIVGRNMPLEAGANLDLSTNTATNVTVNTLAPDENGRVEVGAVDLSVIANLSSEEVTEIVFTEDVEGAATVDNAYGEKTGILQSNNSVIDGQGKTLTVMNAPYAITTNGGTIKNMTIVGGGRGIAIIGASVPVYVDNVHISNSTYTVWGGDTNYGGLFITKSTLNGWTSWGAAVGDVNCKDCAFGSNGSHAYMRPYGKTVLEDCTFSEGYEMDATQCVSSITIKNCYVGETLITAENLTTLLGAYAARAVVE